jgi:hypothetical protein
MERDESTTPTLNIPEETIPNGICYKDPNPTLQVILVYTGNYLKSLVFLKDVCS